MMYLESYRKRINKVVKSYDKWAESRSHKNSDERLDQVAWSDLEVLFRSYRTMIGNTKNVGKILDFGCGNGLLLDFLKQNKIKYEYLGVDIRKEVIEDANKYHPEENFIAIKDIKDVPLDNYDIVLAHGVFTTQMNEDDILEFVDYFKESKKIVFSFIRTKRKRNISHTKDIYTFYNPENLLLFLKSNIDGGTLSSHILNDTDSFITWEKASMVNEGFLSNVGTAVLLAGLSFLYSCGKHTTTQDKIKSIEKSYDLKTANNIPNIKQCKELVKSYVMKNEDIDKSLRDSMVREIDKINFFTINKENRLFGKKSQDAKAFYVKLGKTDLIVINEDYLRTASPLKLTRTIIHELSHYVDALDGTKNEWNLVVDKNIKDKETLKTKLDYIMSNSDFGKAKLLMPEEYDKLLSDISENYTQKHIEYLTSAEEMYVRGVNLKVWLIENKQMNDINDDIERKHINYFLQNIMKQKLFDTDFFPFVLFLDFEQLM